MAMVVVIVIPHTTGGNTFKTPPNLTKMSTLERGMLHHLQGKTADAIARGEEPRVLLIHQLQNLPRKLNLRRHIAGRAEVSHVVRCCSVSSCSGVISDILFRLNHGVVIIV
jgi:hypothetical protein